MKRLSSILLGAVAVGAVGLGGACGGGVSVQGQGGAGSESTTNATGSQSTGSQSTGSQSTGSITTSSSMVTTGTGSSGVCDDLCAKGMQLGCDFGQDCELSCQDVIASAGTCGDEMAAFFACVAATANNCDFFPECEKEQVLLNECNGGSGCEPGECSGTGSGGMTECYCSQVCDGALFEVECKSSGGPTSCQCFVNGANVGGCTENISSGCDVEESCCAMFFNQPGG